MYSDLVGSMLCVDLDNVTKKHYELASVHSAFHSGQILSAHRSNLQIYLEGGNNNELCCLCKIIDFHASLPFLDGVPFCLPETIFTAFSTVFSLFNCTDTFKLDLYPMGAAVTLLALSFVTGIIAVRLGGSV